MPNTILIKVRSKEQFVEDILLNQEDLDNLELMTGISPDRAREIWKNIAKTGIEDFLLEKNYLQSIYEIGLDPDNEKEKEEFPNVYFELNPIEKAYAGYLLGWEQAYEMLNSIECRS